MATVLSNEDEHRLCQCRTGSCAVSVPDLVMNGPQRESHMHAACRPYLLKPTEVCDVALVRDEEAEHLPVARVRIRHVPHLNVLRNVVGGAVPGIKWFAPSSQQRKNVNKALAEAPE